jgi:glucose/arabinose dehydrogenase
MNRGLWLVRPLLMLLLAATLLPLNTSQWRGLQTVLAQDEPSSSDQQVRITRNTNIRSEPSTTASILTTARPDQQFAVTGESADGLWLRIDYNGQSGWVYASLVQMINQGDQAGADSEAVLLPTPTPDAAGEQPALFPTPTAQVADGGAASVSISRVINVRGGPGTTYAVIGSTQAGNQFAVTGQNADGSWWRIDYRGQEGWISAALAQATNTAGVEVISAPPPAPAPAVSSGSGSLAPGGSTPVSGFNPQQVQIRLEPVFGGLGQPTHITHAGDGSGRLFVVERPGRIRVYAGPQTEGQIFLEIEDRVGDNGPEQGLFSVAFPPDYESTGYFFINYTNNDGDTVIARYRVSDDWNRAERDSESVVLFLKQPAANHNGGLLLFGPDGKLWIGMGDGGGANDTFQNGQNPGTLLGKMLRLDVSDPSVPYRVPPDNPWVAADWNGADVLDEVWAVGLRNPWRYSFDRRIGDLWIADVGESQSEEINFIPAAAVRQGGFNFGWPIMEGPHCLNRAGCSTDGLTLPVAEYGRAGNGCSITGGYVYRGAAFPNINGVYFYADFCSGNIWGYWRNNAGPQTALVLPKAAAISSFGEDEAGELYVTDFGGGIVYRLVVQ